MINHILTKQTYNFKFLPFRKVRKGLLILLILIVNYNCKNHYEGLSKSITENLVLASSINNETGETIGEGTEFIIMNDGWIEASLDLSEYFHGNSKDLMIHLDWVNEKGTSFYKKKQILVKNSTKVNTAVSISPELREAGDYKLNVYAFRELIVSEKFTLLSAFKSDTLLKETIKLEVKANRKTTKQKDKSPIIHLMNDKWIKATVKLKNKPKTNKKELLYQLNWIDSKGKIFYKKRYSILSREKKSTFDCSVEVAPNKKETGNYKVQLLLFGNLIAEKQFTLQAQLEASKVKVKTTLCKEYTNDKKIGITTNFNIGKNNKVRAIFDLENCLAFGKKEQLHFKVSWVGSNGKKFYSKRFNFKAKEDKKTLVSAISIPPKKRKPGKYKVQLYLFNQLISEEEFRLK